MSKIFGIEQKSYLGGYIVGGDESTYAPKIWDWMLEFGIKSVLDVGCGEGHSTKYFNEIGIDATGLEGGENAIRNSPIPHKLIQHDFTIGPYTPSKNYDAIWCCEFVEHVEQKYILNFLHTFDYAKYIIMTHALPGQGGYHHVNEQDSRYWIDNIEKRNYTYNHPISLYLRSLSNSRWIKTLLFFEKGA